MAEKMPGHTEITSRSLFLDVDCYYGLAGKYVLESILKANGDFLFYLEDEGHYRLGVRWNDEFLRRKVKPMKECFKVAGIKVKVSSFNELVQCLEFSGLSVEPPEGARASNRVRRPENWSSLSTPVVQGKWKIGRNSDWARCSVDKDGVSADGIIKVAKKSNMELCGNELRWLIALNKNEEVVELQSVFYDRAPFGYVTSYAANGNLEKFITTRSLSQWQKSKMMLDVIRSVSFLASAKVCHGNLSCKNFLVTDLCALKLHGFQFAKKVTLTEKPPVPVKPTRARFPSPELLKTGVFSPTIDVWAAGATCVYIGTDCKTDFYPDTIATRALFLNCDKPMINVPSTITSELQLQIFSRCLVRDARLRPTAKDILDSLLPYSA